MDTAYLVPFISSIQNVCATMLQLQVNIGEPHIKSNDVNNCDVSGIIGMSGDVVGTVVLSFPKDTAESIVQLFTGTKLSIDNADFADAIGELVNMVCGNAKGQFSGKKKVSISCPSVVIGKHHAIASQKDLPCVVIPCSTDCGDLVIEITIREVAPTAETSGTTAAAAAA